MAIEPLPENYHRHIVGEFREAGCTMSGARPILKAVCGCADRHVTYIRSGNLTREYANYKLHWLFNESCYSRE